MNILVVEDDQDLAEMYQLQLVHGGHKVWRAADAQSALDALDKHAIQAVVLDIMLPRHNGISILYELRSYSDWRKLPVIVLSSISAEELGVTSRALRGLGVVDYLDKTRTKAAHLLASVEATQHA